MAKADTERLEQENLALRAKLAEKESGANDTYSVQREIAKLKATQRKKVPIGQISVRESSEHQNVPLYTQDGQMIGPLHPANAEQYIYDMAAQGVKISVTKPTPEQIEAYKNTQEYKDKEKWEKERRGQKNKSHKKGQLEKLAQSIADLSGKKIDEIHGALIKK